MNLKTKGTLMLVVLVTGIVMGCVGQQPQTGIQQPNPAISISSPIYVILGIGGNGITMLPAGIDYKDPAWAKYSEDIYVRLHGEEEITGNNQCSSGRIKIADYDITKTDYQVKVIGHAQISIGKTSDGTECTLSGSTPNIYIEAYGKDGQPITKISSFDLSTSQGIQNFIIQESIIK